MTDTIKQCPFCKSHDCEPVDLGPAKAYAVVCNNCQAMGPECGSIDDSVTIWNMRYKEDME